MLMLVRYATMFMDRVRWYALRTAAQVLYAVLVVGGAIVGFIVGAVATLAAIAFAIFALVATVVGLLSIMGAYRDPLHMLLDVAILGVTALAAIFTVPMYLGLRALRRR